MATYRYPAEKTKGVVIFVHSMGLHVGLAANMAKVFANNGFTFVGFDLRGHGRSEGERGYLDDANLIKEDAHKFIGSIFKMYPNVPIFLMGHGGGSLLALVFSREFTDYKFAGLIMTSPSLKKPAHSKVLSAISDVALKLMPNRTGLFEPLYENVCKNPTASEYLKKDPNCYHGKVFVGTLQQMMHFM